MKIQISQLPPLTKSTPTRSLSSRFTKTCGPNIPNGSSQLASAPRATSTRRA